MQNPRPISIWHPKTVEGQPAFVRPEPGPFGDHYAPRTVIPLEKQVPHRVCFFGESAAAGYLLAPDVTPAQVLGLRLGPDYDVVDLARTNERIDSLIDTIQASLQLSPDVLVVFAGNNWNLLETPEWSPFYPASWARRRYAGAVRQRGIAGPVLEARRALASKVDDLFECLVATRTRTVIVVPEVNLTDWGAIQPVPWFDGELGTWYRLLARAERCLHRGQFGRARVAARQMLELDGGSCSTAFGLLAKGSDDLEEREEATTAFRARVDSAHYPLLALLGAPQARHTDQEMLTDGARRSGFEWVDLREVFASGSDKLPGRALFYDYCHLTPLGIDLAMRAVARAVAGDVRPDPVEVTPPVAARAAIGAAIHGVHRGARGVEVRHWIRKAIAESGTARGALQDVVEARIALAPAVLTTGQLHDHGLTLQHGWKWEGLDAETLAAIQEVAGIDIELGSRGVPRVELWNPLDRFLPEVMEHPDAQSHAVYRSPWPWTHLALLANGPHTVEMVVRGEGNVRLSWNGRCLSRFQLRPVWARWRVRIDLPPGLQKLTLRWPLPSGDGLEGLEGALRLLESGLEAPIHPVFGELYDTPLLSGRGER